MIDARPPGQCGCCSSCLLRRQALAAQRIQDETEYVITDKLLNNEPIDSSYCTHLRAMLHPVDKLRCLLHSDSPWRNVVQDYPTLQLDVVNRLAEQGLSAETIIAQLLELYGRYVQEWDRARLIVGQGLIPTEQFYQPVAN